MSPEAGNHTRGTSRAQSFPPVFTAASPTLGEAVGELLPALP